MYLPCWRAVTASVHQDGAYHLVERSQTIQQQVVYVSPFSRINLINRLLSQSAVSLCQPSLLGAKCC